MSKAIDRFIEAQEGERKARQRLEEIVSQFLKVAEGVKNWQNVAFEWWHGDAAHPLRRSDHPTTDIIRTSDVPTIADVQAAVEEASIAAKILQAATAGLTKKERQKLCRAKDTAKPDASTPAPKGGPSGYVTTNQAARRLGLTRQRMLVIIKQGRLPFEVLNGRYMIKLDDLEKFAAVKRQVGRRSKKTI